MTRHDTIYLFGLIILSVLTSFMFIFYGLGIITSQGATRPAEIFAYVTCAYGLANIAILSIAWNSRERRAVAVSKLVALCFFGVYIMNRFMAGFQMADFAGVVIIAVVLWFNFYAIRKVVERR
ncbi:MAG: hypothetical protein ACWGOL_07715 [Desulfuromonadales bacterium]